MHTSSNAYDECSEFSRPQFNEDSWPTRTTESILSLLLRQNTERKRSNHQKDFSQQIDPKTLNSSYKQYNTSSILRNENRDSQASENPFGSSWYRSCLENHQAKRARVENILQRMAGPTTMCLRDLRPASHSTSNDAWNISGEEQSLLDFKHSRVELLLPSGVVQKTREIPEHSYVLDANHQWDHTTQSSEEEYPESTAATAGVKHEAEECHRSPTLQMPDMAVLRSSPRDFLQPRHRSDVKTQSGHAAFDTGTELRDLLKSELSRAVNKSVDSVFGKMSKYIMKAPHQNQEESDRLFVEDKMKRKDEMPSQCTVSPDITEPSAELSIQSEALSLVIQKPLHQDNPKKMTQMRESFPDSNSGCPQSQSKQNSLLGDPEVQQRYADSPANLSCRYNASPTSLDVASFSWEPMKATSRGCMNQQAQMMALSHLAFDSLRFPHIKRENQSVVDGAPFLPLNDGLTPGHLKKAKLMFFYTRYPSSNVLKTFFPDVKFTRCITSQLIKWFSNFREFYYIQMEKHARHAVVQGVTHSSGLTVDRESELFRALNTHYNKANDFQVPERFLEVVEITLREFYTAISLSRDLDPSWKKAIYKVICKLDSDVPVAFKSPLFT